MSGLVAVHTGDARDRMRALPERSVHCVFTSSPYWGLRFYGTEPQVWGGREDCAHEWSEEMRPRGGGRSGFSEGFDGGTGQVSARQAAREASAGSFCAHCGAWRGELGLEPTPDLFVEHLVMVFEEAWRVLRDDGVLWVNLGDTYATGAGRVGDHPGGGEQGQWWNGRGGGTSHRMGPTTQPNRLRVPGLKQKDLALVPERFVLAMQAAGWTVRAKVVWDKDTGQPESVADRPTTSHEPVFMFTKGPRYAYDHLAVRRPPSEHTLRDKRNPRDAPRIDRGHASGSLPRGGHPLGDKGLGGNLGTVWTIRTEPSFWEFCLGCETFYDGARARRLRRVILSADGSTRPHPKVGKPTLGEGERVSRQCRSCGRADAWVDHFAVMPTELARRVILLSTSQAGCCRECGAQWRRVTTRARARKRVGEPAQVARKIVEARGRVGATSVLKTGVIQEWRTVRWEPACACDAGEPVPCVVLDPFMGSGTTLVTAANHGRRAIGIDLNPKYARLAEHRLHAQAPASLAPRLDSFGGAEA